MRVSLAACSQSLWSKMNVVELTKKAVSGTLTDMGYELVDVEYDKQYGQMTLTVYIYKEGGVDLDDCEKVSRALDPILDEINPTGDEPYSFNVSSPGLDRPFKTQRDFERNYGEEVEVKLYAPLKGKKVYEGVLKEKAQNTFTIICGEEEITIECAKAAFVRPLVKFE
ncbi:MAG: ribosome maturation factor RimP [Clostridiales bacterium]|nr:ribosome maturation factor RimP [Clostridiales bacterium]